MKPHPASAEAAQDLTREEMLHLHDHTFGGLMRKALPDEVAEKFMTMGLIEHRTGGYVPTHFGYAVLQSHGEDFQYK